MLVTSRSFDEYGAMFELSPDDMSGTVLDCSAGAANFVAVARSRGVRAVGIDPAYALPRIDLAAAVREDLGRGSAIAFAHPDRFVWDWFGSPESRDAMRRAAAAQFLSDITTHPHHHLAAELPRLPLRDRCA